MVAKWLTQLFVSGTHWEMPRYEPDLGILTFRAISLSLTTTEARSNIAGRSKNAHVEQLVFTLRSLVTSTLYFDNTPHTSADSCTIAAAFKFAGKDGSPYASNGKSEIELLQTLKATYAKRGLDY